MKLCKRHHVVLCDQLPDAVLDALGIPASDSGDFRYEVSHTKSECEVCVRSDNEVYRVNTFPGLWHVELSNFDENETTVRFFAQATDEIPKPLVCGDLDWWYRYE